MEFSKKEVRDGFTYTFHFTVKGHCRSSVKLCNLGEELVDVIMEVEYTLDPLSASWKPRKDSGIVSV